MHMDSDAQILKRFPSNAYIEVKIISGKPYRYVRWLSPQADGSKVRKSVYLGPLADAASHHRASRRR